MPHRDPRRISTFRYQRRVDRIRHYATNMTCDELSRVIKEYEDDVGRFELILASLGLVNEPAYIAAYRLELADKKRHTK